MRATGRVGGGLPFVAALAVALVAAVFAVGCGGSDDGDTGGDDGTTSGAVDRTEARETLDEAAERIDAAVQADDCEAINELYPVSRQERFDTKQRCKLLSGRLANAELGETESFEDEAGVIDYARGARTLTALMVLDRDGLYHVAALNGILGEASVGTEFADQFDDAAEKTVDAFAEADCKAFLEVASRQLGPASEARSDEDVCAYVENSPLGKLLQEDPKAKAELIGGNADYAFYAVEPEGARFTLVMTRQTDKNAPEGTPKLPKDAGEYVFLDAIPTGAGAPAEEDGADR